MKKAVSSIDVYFLVDELRDELLDARLDKVYQISGRELKIKTRKTGQGSSELIIAPGYLCLTKYKREVPEQPSSFAMQLRKNLKGAFITGIRQHGFDRIVEISFKSFDQEYVLVVELFSKGNVILCDPEKKILGLLEWQKWKDRKLGVGQVYEYPPGGSDPFNVSFEGFEDIVSSSQKKIASVLATDIGLGGVYAEEACLLSGVEKDQRAREVTKKHELFKQVEGIKKKISDLDKKPLLILGEEGYLDVVPFPLEVYSSQPIKEFSSFNDAVDTYFSEAVFSEKKDEHEKKLQEKLDKILTIEKNQEKTVSELSLKADAYREMGDMVYQNLSALEALKDAIEKERMQGRSWQEIDGMVSGKDFSGLRILGVSNGKIRLEVDRG